MKQQRDLDLIRDLLLDLEGVEEVDLSEYSEEEVAYNIYLIIDAGLGEGNVVWEGAHKSRGFGTSQKGPSILSAELWYITSEGQEFLNNARNPEAWKSVTGKIASKGVDVSLDVLKSLLNAYMMGQFGLS